MSLAVTTSHVIGSCQLVIKLFHFHFFSIDATIYVGGLDEKVAETLLWELFLQAGPVGRLKCF